ncbi:MAG: sigma-70 family RNA polymerase sigma factor [Deltaproteobacteria bacterium]|nr:sigma-70 family RNA polymerase sigma factor [Deltaproteobacteria bacterium]
MNPSLEEDRRLLSKCITGDRNASEILVRRFSNLVYHSVQHTLVEKNISFTPQDLEDLHNTIFLQLFEHGCRKLKQYRGKNGCSLASWIRVVAVRVVLNHIRKKGMDAIAWQMKRTPLEDLSKLIGEEMDPLTLMQNEEQDRLVENGIQSLPPRDRLFIRLYFDQGTPIEDVAETMQISVPNAYTIKHRAVRKLKSYVSSMSK